MMKRNRVYNDLYKTEFYFCESSSRNEVEKLTGYSIKGDVFAHTIYSVVYDDQLEYGSIFIVFNRNNLYRSLTAGVVAHEAFHASNIVFQLIGQQPDYDNDEAHAYLLEWIVDKAYESFERFDDEEE